MAAQAGEIALGQQIEMVDQCPHRRIVAVALLELDREAFGQVARADAGRIERLQDGQHRLDFGARRPEFFRDGIEIAAQVAGLVDHIDQVLADHAANRIGDRQRHLFGQMVGERRLRGDEGFEVVVAVLAAGAPEPDHSE